MMFKWQKLGKIFDPREHRLANNCRGFAQYPQPLICEDYVRIYFSARAEDPGGRFLSYMFFVDMDRDLTEVLQVSDRAVIELGELGCFDEHGIQPMEVVPVGEMIYAYTTGWSRRMSVAVDTSIGFAISRDGGLTFQKQGHGPILTSSLHEPFLIADACVRKFGDRFHMWYVYGVRWKQYRADVAPDRTYKIGHAVSEDGIAWQREGRQIIVDKYPDECQARPAVLALDGRYHMVFCYRHSYGFRTNRNRSYRIGYAYSDDLIGWIRDDAQVGIDVTPGDWDSDMLCYPYIFQCDGEVYLLYNGNEFGRYGFGLARLGGMS
jgi:hypothetical protein